VRLNLFWKLALAFLTLLLVALQQFEGHIVAPQVFGHSLRINPLIVIFALLFVPGIKGSIFEFGGFVLLGDDLYSMKMPFLRRLGFLRRGVWQSRGTDSGTCLRRMTISISTMETKRLRCSL